MTVLSRKRSSVISSILKNISLPYRHDMLDDCFSDMPMLGCEEGTAGWMSDAQWAAFCMDQILNGNRVGYYTRCLLELRVKISHDAAERELLRRIQGWENSLREGEDPEHDGMREDRDDDRDHEDNQGGEMRDEEDDEKYRQDMLHNGDEREDGNLVDPDNQERDHEGYFEGVGPTPSRHWEEEEPDEFGMFPSHYQYMDPEDWYFDDDGRHFDKADETEDAHHNKSNKGKLSKSEKAKKQAANKVKPDDTPPEKQKGPMPNKQAMAKSTKRSALLTNEWGDAIDDSTLEEPEDEDGWIQEPESLQPVMTSEKGNRVPTALFVPQVAESKVSLPPVSAERILPNNHSWVEITIPPDTVVTREAVQEIVDHANEKVEAVKVELNQKLNEQEKELQKKQLVNSERTDAARDRFKQIIQEHRDASESRQKAIQDSKEKVEQIRLDVMREAELRFQHAPRDPTFTPPAQAKTKEKEEPSPQSSVKGYQAHSKEVILRMPTKNGKLGNMDSILAANQVENQKAKDRGEHFANSDKQRHILKVGNEKKNKNKARMEELSKEDEEKTKKKLSIDDLKRIEKRKKLKLSLKSIEKAQEAMYLEYDRVLKEIKQKWTALYAQMDRLTEMDHSLEKLRSTKENLEKEIDEIKTRSAASRSDEKLGSLEKKLVELTKQMSDQTAKKDKMKLEIDARVKDVEKFQTKQEEKYKANKKKLDDKADALDKEIETHSTERITDIDSEIEIQEGLKTSLLKEMDAIKNETTEWETDERWSKCSGELDKIQQKLVALKKKKQVLTLQHEKDMAVLDELIKEQTKIKEELEKKIEEAASLPVDTESEPSLEANRTRLASAIRAIESLQKRRTLLIMPFDRDIFSIKNEILETEQEIENEKKKEKYLQIDIEKLKFKTSTTDTTSEIQRQEGNLKECIQNIKDLTKELESLEKQREDVSQKIEESILFTETEIEAQRQEQRELKDEITKLEDTEDNTNDALANAVLRLDENEILLNALLRRLTTLQDELATDKIGILVDSEPTPEANVYLKTKIEYENSWTRTQIDIEEAIAKNDANSEKQRKRWDERVAYWTHYETHIAKQLESQRSKLNEREKTYTSALAKIEEDIRKNGAKLGTLRKIPDETEQKKVCELTVREDLDGLEESKQKLMLIRNQSDAKSDSTMLAICAELREKKHALSNSMTTAQTPEETQKIQHELHEIETKIELFIHENRYHQMQYHVTLDSYIASMDEKIQKTLKMQELIPTNHKDILNTYIKRSKGFIKTLVDKKKLLIKSRDTLKADIESSEKSMQNASTLSKNELEIVNGLRDKINRDHDKVAKRLARSLKVGKTNHAKKMDLLEAEHSHHHDEKEVVSSASWVEQRYETAVKEFTRRAEELETPRGELAEALNNIKKRMEENPNLINNHAAVKELEDVQIKLSSVQNSIAVNKMDLAKAEYEFHRGMTFHNAYQDQVVIEASRAMADQLKLHDSEKSKRAWNSLFIPGLSHRENKGPNRVSLEERLTQYEGIERQMDFENSLADAMVDQIENGTDRVREMARSQMDTCIDLQKKLLNIAREEQKAHVDVVKENQAKRELDIAPIKKNFVWFLNGDDRIKQHSRYLEISQKLEKCDPKEAHDMGWDVNRDNLNADWYRFLKMFKQSNQIEFLELSAWYKQTILRFNRYDKIHLAIDNAKEIQNEDIMDPSGNPRFEFWIYDTVHIPMNRSLSKAEMTRLDTLLQRVPLSSSTKPDTATISVTLSNLLAWKIELIRMNAMRYYLYGLLDESVLAEDTEAAQSLYDDQLVDICEERLRMYETKLTKFDERTDKLKKHKSKEQKPDSAELVEQRATYRKTQMDLTSEISLLTMEIQDEKTQLAKIKRRMLKADASVLWEDVDLAVLCHNTEKKIIALNRKIKSIKSHKLEMYNRYRRESASVPKKPSEGAKLLKLKTTKSVSLDPQERLKRQDELIAKIIRTRTEYRRETRLDIERLSKLNIVLTEQVKKIRAAGFTPERWLLELKDPDRYYQFDPEADDTHIFSVVQLTQLNDTGVSIYWFPLIANLAITFPDVYERFWKWWLLWNTYPHKVDPKITFEDKEKDPNGSRGFSMDYRDFWVLFRNKHKFYPLQVFEFYTPEITFGDVSPFFELDFACNHMNTVLRTWIYESMELPVERLLTENELTRVLQLVEQYNKLDRTSTLTKQQMMEFQIELLRCDAVEHQIKLNARRIRDLTSSDVYDHEKTLELLKFERQLSELMKTYQYSPPDPKFGPLTQEATMRIELSQKKTEALKNIKYEKSRVLEKFSSHKERWTENRDVLKKLNQERKQKEIYETVLQEELTEMLGTHGVPPSGNANKIYISWKVYLDQLKIDDSVLHNKVLKWYQESTSKTNFEYGPSSLEDPWPYRNEHVPVRLPLLESEQEKIYIATNRITQHHIDFVRYSDERQRYPNIPRVDEHLNITWIMVLQLELIRRSHNVDFDRQDDTFSPYRLYDTDGVPYNRELNFYEKERVMKLANMFIMGKDVTPRHRAALAMEVERILVARELQFKDVKDPRYDPHELNEGNRLIDNDDMFYIFRQQYGKFLVEQSIFREYAQRMPYQQQIRHVKLMSQDQLTFLWVYDTQYPLVPYHRELNPSEQEKMKNIISLMTELNIFTDMDAQFVDYEIQRIETRRLVYRMFGEGWKEVLRQLARVRGSSDSDTIVTDQNIEYSMDWAWRSFLTNSQSDLVKNARDKLWRHSISRWTMDEKIARIQEHMRPKSYSPNISAEEWIKGMESFKQTYPKKYEDFSWWIVNSVEKESMDDPIYGVWIYESSEIPILRPLEPSERHACSRLFNIEMDDPNRLTENEKISLQLEKIRGQIEEEYLRNMDIPVSTGEIALPRTTPLTKTDWGRILDAFRADHPQEYTELAEWFLRQNPADVRPKPSYLQHDVPHGDIREVKMTWWIYKDTSIPFSRELTTSELDAKKKLFNTIDWGTLSDGTIMGISFRLMKKMEETRMVILRRTYSPWKRGMDLLQEKHPKVYAKLQAKCMKEFEYLKFESQEGTWVYDTDELPLTGNISEHCLTELERIRHEMRTYNIAHTDLSNIPSLKVTIALEMIRQDWEWSQNNHDRELGYITSTIANEPILVQRRTEGGEDPWWIVTTRMQNPRQGVPSYPRDQARRMARNEIFKGRESFRKQNQMLLDRFDHSLPTFYKAVTKRYLENKRIEYDIQQKEHEKQIGNAWKWKKAIQKLESQNEDMYRLITEACSNHGLVPFSNIPDDSWIYDGPDFPLDRDLSMSENVRIKSWVDAFQAAPLSNNPIPQFVIFAEKLRAELFQDRYGYEEDPQTSEYEAQYAQYHRNESRYIKRWKDRIQKLFAQSPDLKEAYLRQIQEVIPEFAHRIEDCGMWIYDTDDLPFTRDLSASEVQAIFVLEYRSGLRVLPLLKPHEIAAGILENIRSSRLNWIESTLNDQTVYVIDYQKWNPAVFRRFTPEYEKIRKDMIAQWARNIEYHETGRGASDVRTLHNKMSSIGLSDYKRTRHEGLWMFTGDEVRRNHVMDHRERHWYNYLRYKYFYHRETMFFSEVVGYLFADIIINSGMWDAALEYVHARCPDAYKRLYEGLEDGETTLLTRGRFIYTGEYYFKTLELNAEEQQSLLETAGRISQAHFDNTAPRISDIIVMRFESTRRSIIEWNENITKFKHHHPAVYDRWLSEVKPQMKNPETIMYAGIWDGSNHVLKFYVKPISRPGLTGHLGDGASWDTAELEDEFKTPTVKYENDQQWLTDKLSVACMESNIWAFHILKFEKRCKEGFRRLQEWFQEYFLFTDVDIYTSGKWTVGDLDTYIKNGPPLHHDWGGLSAHTVDSGNMFKQIDCKFKEILNDIHRWNLGIQLLKNKPNPTVYEQLSLWITNHTEFSCDIDTDGMWIYTGSNLPAANAMLSLEEYDIICTIARSKGKYQTLYPCERIAWELESLRNPLSGENRSNVRPAKPYTERRPATSTQNQPKKNEHGRFPYAKKPR